MAAGVLPTRGDNDQNRDNNDADVLYGHGMVWNRDLPGVAGDLKLSFDLRVNLETGKGFGTAEDPIHPDWNIHFSIDSLKKEKQPKGESRFTLGGAVTRANDPSNVQVTIFQNGRQIADVNPQLIRDLHLGPGDSRPWASKNYPGRAASGGAWDELWHS